LHLHDGQREQPAVHTVTQAQAAPRLQAVFDLIEPYRQKWLAHQDRMRRRT
jgi:transposase